MDQHLNVKLTDVQVSCDYRLVLFGLTYNHNLTLSFSDYEDYFFLSRSFPLPFLCALLRGRDFFYFVYWGVQVVDSERFPQLQALSNCFIRGSVSIFAPYSSASPLGLAMNCPMTSRSPLKRSDAQQPSTQSRNLSLLQFVVNTFLVS